eukprot:1151876-Pelagomonas_calceolata.AAC.2
MQCSIKPVKESAKQGLETDKCGSAMVSRNTCGSGLADLVDTHCLSYIAILCTITSLHAAAYMGLSLLDAACLLKDIPVQLVLEYCDRSSLRDALDAGTLE